MNLTNRILVSLVLPLVTAVVLVIIIPQDNPEAGWMAYAVLFLLMFVLWGVTAFIGEFIFYLTERRKVQRIIVIALQAVLIAGFSYFMLRPGVAKTDKDENMKMNRLMVDYDRRLDDSLTTFPNSIRIAYKKLESQFANPNDFTLTYFGSKNSNLVPATRTVYFSYKIHDSEEVYSKIQVLKDTAHILTFNKNIDTEFLNSKKRIQLLWTSEHMQSILGKGIEADTAQ